MRLAARCRVSRLTGDLGDTLLELETLLILLGLLQHLTR
jgi:hypothetical protein